jgi:hypothetical protein
VLTAVLHRSQHQPGSPKQAQTRPDGSTYSIVQGTPAFAEIGPIYFGLWCAKNGVLNKFSHLLLFEIPSRGSLLAKTDIILRTVTNLPLGSSRLLVPGSVRLCCTAQATAAGHQDHCCRCTPHSPTGCRCGSGRWAPPEREAGAIRLQELAGDCLHMKRAGKPVAKAHGQSARQSVRTICSLERADTLLAETRTRSARRQADNCIQWGTIRRASRIPSNFVLLRPDEFALCSGSETRTI